MVIFCAHNFLAGDHALIWYHLPNAFQVCLAQWLMCLDWSHDSAFSVCPRVQSLLVTLIIYFINVLDSITMNIMKYKPENHYNIFANQYNWPPKCYRNYIHWSHSMGCNVVEHRLASHWLLPILDHQCWMWHFLSSATWTGLSATKSFVFKTTYLAIGATTAPSTPITSVDILVEAKNATSASNKADRAPFNSWTFRSITFWTEYSLRHKWPTQVRFLSFLFLFIF